MMKIKYLGTPGESHKAISMYGYVFPLGQAVEVTDAFAARKLAQHPHFASRGEVEDVVDKRTVQAVELLLEVAIDEQAELAQEEADTIAALTDEEKYGNAHGTGAEGAAQAESLGGERGSKRGRPAKGS